jgi:fluoroacetyl-CoA thioesterase
MSETPRVGESFTFVLPTDSTMSASRFQKSSPDVFATPFLVGAVEAAAARLMEKWLAPGEMSVGGGFELRHTAPTPLGWEVRTTAKLVEHKGKKFVFEVECFDELEKIGDARHTRFIVPGDAFAAQVREKTGRRAARS